MPQTPPSAPLRWFPEFLTESGRRLRPQSRLLVLSLVVGLFAGLGAILFYLAGQTVFHFTLTSVAGYHPPAVGGEPPLFAPGTTPLRPWLLVVVPAIGGLVCGWIVYTWAPEAEGHGTDAVIEAYHQHEGKIRPRVPLVKMIASAITLGTGGSGGREGPIAQIGAGFGSFLGSILHLSASERRTLLAAGMGAGIGAIFRAPLAGALFAAEVLYSSADFESEVLIPAGLSTVTAYCTFGLALGWTPLFVIPPEVLGNLQFNNPLELAAYLLLAIAMVVLAMLYTRTFYGLTYALHRLPVPAKLRPMIGSTLTGAVAVALYYAFGRDERVLAVLSFGYGMLQQVLVIPPAEAANLSLAWVLLAVAFGKILTTSLTIGSGGSAGVFGASMVIGGCAGAATGIILHHFVPHLVHHPASFAIVGMAGFFAAAAKTPFSTLVIVSEMTGNYNLLLPSLWVCAVAFLLSDRQSIYSAQVTDRARSPVHGGKSVLNAE
ncbi:MAG: chloride channel protein [Planctomycetia bacterium]|nr:chloride channel protein [Planctomycetia bacterium]